MTFIPESLKTEGLFTTGSTFLLDGEEYVGQYNLVNNVPFSGPMFISNVSVELTSFTDNELLAKYETLVKDQKIKSIRNFKTPVAFKPTPSLDEYDKRFIERYFVKRRNDSNDPVIEIDKEQFDSIKAGSTSGINQNLYFGVSLRWRLVGQSKVEVELTNKNTLVMKESEIPGISNSLENLSEFAQFY